MYVGSFTLIQAIDNDNKWGVFEGESGRMKALKRFDDELRELGVDGLLENHGVDIDSGFDK